MEHEKIRQNKLKQRFNYKTNWTRRNVHCNCHNHQHASPRKTKVPQKAKLDYFRKNPKHSCFNKTRSIDFFLKETRRAISENRGLMKTTIKKISIPSRISLGNPSRISLNSPLSIGNKSLKTIRSMK